MKNPRILLELEFKVMKFNEIRVIGLSNHGTHLYANLLSNGQILLSIKIRHFSNKLKSTKGSHSNIER